MSIWIYITAGITAINLLCLLNRKQRNNWEDLWYDTIIKSFEHLKGQNGLVKYFRFIIFLILIPIMLTTFLLVAPFSTIENMLKKNSKARRKNKAIEVEDNQQYYKSTGVQYEDYIKSFWHSLDDNGNPLFEKERAIQLYYQRMSGQGIISCYDCGYKEEIVSFLHGLKRADCDKDCDEEEDCDEESDECIAGTATGYQCQSCGKFHELNEIEDKVKPLICSCGGELSRDKHLFCPQCKSTNMEYRCRIIT